MSLFCFFLCIKFFSRSFSRWERAKKANLFILRNLDTEVFAFRVKNFNWIWLLDIFGLVSAAKGPAMQFRERIDVILIFFSVVRFFLSFDRNANFSLILGNPMAILLQNSIAFWNNFWLTLKEKKSHQTYTSASYCLRTPINWGMLLAQISVVGLLCETKQAKQ